MISRLKGVLLSREIGRIEIEMASGVVYEVHVPLSIAQDIPPAGEKIEILTLYVVKEESATLFGFLEPHEREVFARVMAAQGVGTKVALAMLSTYPARRLARAILEKDIAALSQVPGIGKKKAEGIALQLSDRMKDLATATAPEAERGVAPGAEQAIAALVALGYTFVDADRAVHAVLADGVPRTVQQLIRNALAGAS